MNICIGLLVLISSIFDGCYGESLLCEIGEALRDAMNPANVRMCSQQQSSNPYNYGQSTSCPANYVCTSISTGQIAAISTSVCCPSKTIECSLHPQAGSSCGAASPSQRYYFDPNKGQCVSFVYNGCFGNNNNFHTKEDCERICLSSLCPRGTPALTTDPTGQPTPENGAQLQKHFQQCAVSQFGQQPVDNSQCPSNYQCTALNNPTTFIASQSGVCCPSSTYICSLPASQGVPCPFNTQPMRRYHFDSTSRTCHEFDYLGCDGNENNFASSQECAQYCVLGSSGSPMLPGPTMPGQPGFTGQYCPAGQQLSPQQPQCQQFAAMQQQCPFGFYCYHGSMGNQGYCCSTPTSVPPSTPASCPSGSTAQTGQMGMPVQCSSQMECTNGYVCEYSQQTQTKQCCSNRDPWNRMCPSGSNPHPSMIPCNVMQGGQGTCPMGYTCQQSPQSAQSYCCSSSTTQPPNQLQNQYCSFGTTPSAQYTPGASCTVMTAVQCPPNYPCQPSSNGYIFYCCRSSTPSLSTQLCPTGLQPQPGADINRPCQSPFSTCYPGFTCQRSPINGQLYCCGNQGTPGPTGPIGIVDTTLCPAGSSPAPGVTYSTPCVPNQPCTQPGYICQASPRYTGLNYCCSQFGMNGGTSGSQCLSGGTPRPQPGTGMSATCVPGDQTCLPPFTCQTIPTNPYTGVCCLSSPPTNTMSQECPAGYTAYRQNGQVLPCGQMFQLCQSYQAQCMLSPIMNMYICCIRPFTGGFGGMGGTGDMGGFFRTGIEPIKCTSDAECTDKVKDSKCDGKKCTCSDGSTAQEGESCPVSKIN